MKKNHIIMISIAAMIVLAGAAFMAMRLFDGFGLDQAMGGSGDMQISPGSKDSGKIVKPVKVEIDPAPELPKQKNQTYGLISTVKDNSLIVQVGERIFLNESPDGSIHPSSDGPSLEVVITQKTRVYRETTYDTHQPADGGKIQQTVEVMNAGKVEKNDIATVWGSKRGDRLVADVILINSSIRLKTGGGK
jgi:hypothetical protein